MKTIALILLSFCLTAGLEAQQDKADSLRKLLRADRSDSVKARHLIALSQYFKRVGITDSAIYYGVQAVEFSEKNKFLVMLCDASGNLGSMYHDKGDTSKSLEYYYKALKLAEQRGDQRSIADNYVRIGIIYDEQNDLDKALKGYEEALPLYEKLNDKERISLALGNIGNVYFSKKDFPKALEYYRQAVKTDEELKNDEGMMFTLGYMGLACTELGKIKEGSEKGSGDSLFREALNYYQRALIVAEKMGDKRLMSNWVGNIGVLYMVLRKNGEAERYLLRSLVLADSAGGLEEKMQFESSTSELYAQMGDFRKSLEHYKQFTRVKDSLFTMEKNKEITRHEMSYEFEKKESAIRAEHEQKEREAQEKSRKQKMLIGGIIAVLVFVLVILIIIFRSLRVTRRQKGIIERQKHLVDEKQKEIIDSILYARRIQKALMPSERYFEKKFSGLRKK
jgi:tetratricopeptide (TPR) repeat protein